MHGGCGAGPCPRLARLRACRAALVTLRCRHVVRHLVQHPALDPSAPAKPMGNRRFIRIRGTTHYNPLGRFCSVRGARSRLTRMGPPGHNGALFRTTLVIGMCIIFPFLCGETLGPQLPEELLRCLQRSGTYSLPTCPSNCSQPAHSPRRKQ